MTGDGTRQLMNDIQMHLTELKARLAEEAASGADKHELEIVKEVHQYSLDQREKRRARRLGREVANEDDDEDGDDYDVEVHYEP